jgi:DNA-binding MarR family transcriptional regulator
MVQLGMILRVIRTIGAPTLAREELVADIMAEFHVFIGELRCAGTERLLKAGVSMTNLHVLSLLSQHGEMSMSRLAELLDVSLSNATGLMDRMEERALVERVRVSDDRRIVLVRLTAGGSTTL